MDTAYAQKGHTLASIVQAGDPVQGGRSAGQGKRAADRRPPRASPSTGAGWASRAMSFILMAPSAIAAAQRQQHDSAVTLRARSAWRRALQFRITRRGNP